MARASYAVVLLTLIASAFAQAADEEMDSKCVKVIDKIICLDIPASEFDTGLE